MQNHYDFNTNQILIINKSCTFIQDFDLMFSLEKCKKTKVTWPWFKIEMMEEGESKKDGSQVCNFSYSLSTR